MQLQMHTGGLNAPRNRYILPISLTAVASLFAILFAGAKISHVLNSDASPQSSPVLAVAPERLASR